MGILYTAVMAAWLVTGAATEPQLAAHGLSGSTEAGAGFITREWTWTTGAKTQSFTAYGPADQVDRLDPLDSTPHCPGCQLASSMSVVPEAGSVPTEVAD